MMIMIYGIFLDFINVTLYTQYIVECINVTMFIVMYVYRYIYIYIYIYILYIFYRISIVYLFEYS